MFTQFKNYVEKATLPIIVASGSGMLAGCAAGVAVITVATSQNPALEGCVSGELNSKLTSEIIGGLSGLCVGAVLGAVFPATHMFFDWCNTSGRRGFNIFRENIGAAQDIEIGNIRPT